MNKKVLLAGIVIIIAALTALSLSISSRKHHDSDSIKVSGNIEATDMRLSFQVAGKIQKLLTDEGCPITKGQILASLDKDELTRIRDQARAKLDEAAANMTLLKEDYGRAENLFKEGSISAQQRDAAKANFDVADAKSRESQASLELADLRLGYADLVSPIDGFVIVKSAEMGEVVQVGATIFTVADLNDIWLTAYINETDLGRVKLNQACEVKTDTFPNKVYKARISFVSQEAEFTPKQIQTPEERVKLVYRIKIKIENPNLELKPGMPADGIILQ